MKQLKGRVAAVTGAGSGIGRATALELARAGCHLALADISEEGLVETERELRSPGVRVTRHVVDVSDRRLMEAFAASAAEAHGTVNIVVNNAGVTLTAPFEQQSMEDFEWLVGINFWGVVYGCRFFLPYLKQAGEGHIVNVSSILGLIGVPTQSSYVATKFAVRGFSESLRAELAGSNIGVTVVHPGLIRTNIIRNTRFTSASSTISKDRAQKLFDRQALPPSAVAAAITRAIRRNEARVLVARETFVTDYLKRLSPVWTSELFQRVYSRFLD